MIPRPARMSNLDCHRRPGPSSPARLDASTAEYLGAEFVWLPDLGISGNGHMLMMENNSEEIATLALAWLQAKGF